MDSPRITYISRHDATPEAELDALAACYRYVLFSSQAKGGGPYDLTNNTTTEHLGKRTTERTETEKTDVTKLTAQGYELLPPNRYVLEVMQAKPVKEYGPQLEVRNRVAEGEYEGFEFTDYPNRGVEDGVKVGTKAWDIFEACLDRRLAPDEELDTEDLIGKRFEAMVVAKKTGKGNRTEHGTIGPPRPKKAPLKEEPKVEEPDDPDAEFKNIPF